MNGATAPGIWLVTWKKGREGYLPYGELVEELLCFGWIDGQARRVDEARTSLLCTPRRRGSGWSRPNKERIDRMRAAGLLRPSGEAAISRAVEDGSWTILDDVEALIEPPELVARLDADPQARTAWDEFPRSARRAALEWIAQARTALTRDRRISETVAACSAGRRPR